MRFAKFLNPYRFKGLIVVICLVLTTAVSLAPPYITKTIIDDIIPAKQYTTLLVAIGLLCGLMLTNMILSFASNYLYAWCSNRIVRDMRVRMFRKLLDLPISSLDNRKTGDLVYRLNSDVAVIESMLTSSALHSIHSVLTLIGLIVLLMWLNASLFLLTVIGVPLFVLNLTYFQPRIRRNIEKMQKKGSDISSYVIERFKNVSLIKLTNSSRRETDRFRFMSDDLIELIMRNVLYYASMNSVSGGLAALTPLFIMGFGAYQVMQDVMSLGALVAFLQYSVRLFQPVRNLHDMYIGLVRGLVSMRRVLEFMQIPSEVGFFAGRKQFTFGRQIDLQDVYFSFESQTVLRGVKFSMAKGKSYALVGASGSGKSTIANLLCGLHLPDRGCINIDNVQMREFELSDLRRNISLVSQRVHLFHDSVGENIRYGSARYNSSEIDRVMEMVGLNDLNQHETIGEQGVQMSGGQRQRLAIARALLNPAELLIMDEATAALDPQNEHTILRNVRRIFAGKTILVISHRLNVVRNVDEVICIDNGTVVEQGQPQALLQKQSFLNSFFSTARN